MRITVVDVEKPEESLLLNDNANQNTTSQIIDQLTQRSREMQEAKTFIDSKINSSFFKYSFSGFLRTFNLAVLFNSVMVSIFYLYELIESGKIAEESKRFYLIEAYMEGLALIVSLPFSYMVYKKTNQLNTEEGRFNPRWQRLDPLSVAEAMHVGNVLNQIEYDHNISPASTGEEVRLASKALSDEIKIMDKIIYYNGFMKQSLFSALPVSIPQPLKEIIADYGMTLTNEDVPLALAFRNK